MDSSRRYLPYIEKINFLVERFGANKRTENERISDNINEGDGYWIDHSAKDTKMVFHPDWKEI